MGYLFFVARGDGTHVFSRTKQEHDRARAQIKKNSHGITRKATEERLVSKYGK
jgi:hypothetical protein